MTSCSACTVSSVEPAAARRPLLAMQSGHVELDEEFTGLADEHGLMTIAGFGDIFFARGIARLETLEMSSLSVEEAPGHEVIVTLFEVEATPGSIQAFIQREHEFRFVAVEPHHLDGSPTGRKAVMCARWNDADYKRRRCPPEEWQRRYGKHGVDRIWRDDVLPCRVYLRHCVLAASKLGEPAHSNFLDASVLGDRKTTVRQHLARDPAILEELPPPELIGRYSG
ncbi:hypothetical protein N2152v2_009531 [Parachlorella kessleri]